MYIEYEDRHVRATSKDTHIIYKLILTFVKLRLATQEDVFTIGDIYTRDLLREMTR